MNSRNVFTISFILFVLGHLTFCQIKNPKPEDFKNFYNLYTSDSSFQISRVIFPLKGSTYYLKNASDIDSIPWIKEKWSFATANSYKIDSTKYSCNLLIQNNLVIEKIILKNSGFGFERRFKLIDNKWYLVYFLVYSN